MHSPADPGAVETAPIFVSLSSFGAADVLRDGQARFVHLCHAAGADGVEIRGELLRNGDREIDELAPLIHEAGLTCVYSSPELLWDAARQFAPRVRYVHCKGVQRQPTRWIAVPLADSLAPWRSILRSLPADAPRAIEFPLVGEDLTQVTRLAVEGLRNEHTEAGS